MKRMLLIASLAAANFALPALAARPQPTLTFSSDPVYPYYPYDVSGCGYPKSTALTLEYEQSWKGYGYYFAVSSDALGCFRYGTFQAGEAGTNQEFTVYHGAKVLAQKTLQTVAA
jgi:hypothetical protein